MEMNETENGNATISLRTLWEVLKRCWILMLVAAILFGIMVFALYRMVYTPIYSSTCRFYVSNIAETTSLYSSSQTQGAESMAEIFTHLVEADDLLDTVIQDTGAGISRLELRRMVSASSNSAILSVKVAGPDKVFNFRISQSIEKYLPAYCDYFNNQADALDPTHESKTLKVIETSRPAVRADNRSNLYRYPVLAALLAAVAVYAIFFLVEITNTTIYSAEDLKAKAGKYSVIGAIEHWSLDGEKKRARYRKKRRANDLLRANVDQKLILRDNVPFRIAEAFHELRTNITFCAAGEKGCTVGVISSIAGSGKSFVMANLAVSLSKLYDKKVLLVDGDMRCPMQHKIFSVSNKIGLSNLIVGQAEDPEAVRHQFENLDLITAGTLPPNPIDLLTGPSMAALMAKWKEEYDYILMDLPPIGEVSDALAISSLISGYVYVIRSGFTDSRLLRDTTDIVEEKNAKIYGYVITDIHPEHLEGYGYGKYSHYYKYGKYGHYQSYSRRYAEAEKKAESNAKQAKAGTEGPKQDQ